MRRSFLFAVFTLVGTTVGAGVFALPGLFARFGMWRASICYWILAFFVITIQCLYVDVITSVPTSHRLPGYARLTLGKRWGAIATVTHFLPMYGAHVIYLLLGGAFLQALLGQFGVVLPERVTMVAVFLFVAAAVWGGLRRVSRVDAGLAAFNLVLFVILTTIAWRQGPAPTQFIAHPSWEAFGLVLFALSALSIVPEAVELCARQKEAARRAVLMGTGIAAFVVWLFALAFAYAGGTQLTGQPQSLITILPAWAAPLLPLMGLLAVTTAYLAMSEALQASWQHDYRFRFASSWAVALIPSFFIALCLRDGFVLLATILGAMCGGANGVLIGLMRVTMAEKRRQTWALVLGLCVVFVYAFGMSGQIASWLFL